MLKFFLWLRYLKKRRVVFLSIAAVAISVALLITVSSIFTGFINAVSNSGEQTFGDLQLITANGIPQRQKLQRKLYSLPEVEATAAEIRTFGLLRLNIGDIKPAQAIGIEPEQYSRVTNLADSIINVN